MVEDREVKEDEDEAPESPSCSTTRTTINHDKDEIAGAITERTVTMTTTTMMMTNEEEDGG